MREGYEGSRERHGTGRNMGGGGGGHKRKHKKKQQVVPYHVPLSQSAPPTSHTVPLHYSVQ